jgi:uncharacterized OB-fold protein
MKEQTMQNSGKLVNADSVAFWSGVEQGQLMFQRCPACASVQFPPRHHCASCWDAEPQGFQSSGRGVIESVTIVRRAPLPKFAGDTPYALAAVLVEEGPRMITRIVGEGALDAVIGDKVEVVFTTDDEGLTLPNFTLAASS